MVSERVDFEKAFSLATALTHAMADKDEDLDMVRPSCAWLHRLTCIADRAEAQDQSHE